MQLIPLIEAPLSVFRRTQNEMIIFPYITIIERAINRENLRKFQNKIFPFNGVRLYSLETKLFFISICSIRIRFRKRDVVKPVAA